MKLDLFIYWLVVKKLKLPFFMILAIDLITFIVNLTFYNLFNFKIIEKVY